MLIARNIPKESISEEIKEAIRELKQSVES